MQTTTRIEECGRCGREVARCYSQRTQKYYSTQIEQRVTVGEEIMAETDTRNFHNCAPADVERFRASHPLPGFAKLAGYVRGIVAKGAKKLAITLQTEEGFRISITFKAGRGVLYVTNGAGYESADNRYFGAVVLEDGSWKPGRDRDNRSMALLAEFEANPAEAAARFGKLTGRCSFCALPLDDERSVQHGYGPVCAKKYGLPWNAARSKAA